MTYVAVPAPANFRAAEDRCVQLGGHLATVQNPISTTAIITLEPGEAWIGLHHTCESGGFEWLDGTTNRYSNFLTAPVDDRYDRFERGCVNSANGPNTGQSTVTERWTAADLGYGDSIFAQLVAEERNGQQLVDPTSCCDLGCLRRGSCCYPACGDNGEPISSSNMFADQSIPECAALCDADPSCVGFEYGVAYGGDGTYQPRDCQLSSSADMGGCDGGQHNLDFYAPTASCGTQCVRLHTDGKWEEDTCTGDRPSVCAFSAGTTPTMSYVAMTTRLSWQAASDFCVELGGNLASLHSEEHTAAVLAMVPVRFALFQITAW